MGPRGPFFLLGLGVFAFLVGDSGSPMGCWVLVRFLGVDGVRVRLLESGSSDLIGGFMLVVASVNEGKRVVYGSGKGKEGKQEDKK